MLSLNIKNTTSITAVSVSVIFVVASIIGFQLTEIIAEETSENKGYKFAEDTLITGVFKFQEGTEIYNFEVFEQKSGFKMSDSYVFDLERIVGNTPLLHEAADHAYMYRSSQSIIDDKEFSVQVLISQGGELKRIFNYQDCVVSDYNIETLFDKEEGWIGKTGFAVIDKFKFKCDSYFPENPQYEQMNIKPKGKTTSTMDLKETDSWSDHFKFNGGS